ncbi:MAG: ribonuclease J [Hyphomicrobiales bacterium]|nr:ribonuclease J [Hyphomicrobiales bacterium]
MSKEELLFIPLGGVGEIGMNLALYGYGTKGDCQWIMVDCGVTFPDMTLPGVDLILPDIRYVQELGDRLKAIIITHAHEDHYGALLSLWPILKKPVYCTPFCAGMLEAKAVYERDKPEIPVNIFEAGNIFEVGPFKIEAVHVTHSLPEPMSLAISTPLGTVVHTADWKIDSDPTLGRVTDEEAFRRIGEDGVLAAICDSTNAMRTGDSPSELEVSESLADIISSAKGRVAITTFSSNVGRLRSIAHAAKKNNRRVMLMGSSIRRVVEVSSDLGYFDDIDEFVDERDFDTVDRANLVIILTGSQGEPRAAMAKIAKQEHRNVALVPGDTVVYSSRIIPGNEKAIIETKNLLIDQGINIITDRDTLVHVSGHPRQNELKEMYSWLKPQISVPVHGEAAHLSAHARLAGNIAVPQVAPVRNGDVLRLAPGNAEIVDNVPHGRYYKDGIIFGDEREIGVTQRRKLGYAGIVSLSIVLDRNGNMADEIDIEIYGLPEITGEGEEFDDVLYHAATGALNSIPPKRRKDAEVVRKAVRNAVRASARDHWGKKPVTTVFVAMI